MFKIAIFSLWVFSVGLFAAPVPESILTKHCLKSYQETYKSLESHKAFVYARESETGKDKCGWGYGHATGNEAKKGAMKQCTSFQLNAECIIVDLDDTYLVKDGDFSFITQPDNTPLTKKEEEKLLAEAKSVIQGNCMPFFKAYLKDKGHKVFGYSVESSTKYACGKAYDNATRISAKKGALRACEDNRNQRGKEKPSSPCRLYAEGNKILLHTQDFNMSKPSKPLSEAEYNKYFKKASTIIKEGPCLFQMKYYLKGSQHQAYFLAQDKDGIQVCGRSEEESSLKEALAQALKECQNRVSQKGLKATCKVLAKDFNIVGSASDLKTEAQADLKTNIKKIPSLTDKNSSNKDDSNSVKNLLGALKKVKKKNSDTKTIDLNKPVPLKVSIVIATDVYNKDLPKMLDEELRLNKVDADGNKMIFDYTLVHFTPESMTAKKLTSLMYSDVKKQVCSDNETVMMLKKGMKIDYLYHGEKNKHITTFAFDAKTCGVLTNVEQIKKNIFNLIKKKP